jgi:hypothetical protein
MLAINECGGEWTFEFAAVVGLPHQVAQRDAVAIQMLLNTRSETALATLRFSAKDQNSKPLRTSRAVY